MTCTVCSNYSEKDDDCIIDCLNKIKAHYLDLRSKCKRYEEFMKKENISKDIISDESENENISFEIINSLLKEKAFSTPNLLQNSFQKTNLNDDDEVILSTNRFSDSTSILSTDISNISKNTDLQNSIENPKSFLLDNMNNSILTHAESNVLSQQCIFPRRIKSFRKNLKPIENDTSFLNTLKSNNHIATKMKELSQTFSSGSNPKKKTVNISECESSFLKPNKEINTELRRRQSKLTLHYKNEKNQKSKNSTSTNTKKNFFTARQSNEDNKNSINKENKYIWEETNVFDNKEVSFLTKENDLAFVDFDQNNFSPSIISAKSKGNMNPSKILIEKDVRDVEISDNITEKTKPKFDCQECNAYYQFINCNLSPSKVGKRIITCKHKKNELRAETPEGFWNPCFDPTQANDPRNETLIDTRFIQDVKKKYNNFL